MTQIEKMKEWLEALEYIDDGANNQGAHTGISWRCVSNKAQPAIASLRQAIAEAEAEKVEYAYTCVGCDYISWANNFSCECQSPPLMKFKRVKVIR